jgi:hypothetical protein
MKNRFLSLALICGLALLPSLRAADAAPKGMSGKEPDTELGDKMDKISAAYKKLGKQINDATKNEDSLAQVAIIHESVDAALKLEPAKKADIPAADQAKFVADYQTAMKAFLDQVVKLEAALKANDNATAAKILATFKGMEDDDHKEFRKKKKM